MDEPPTSLPPTPTAPTLAAPTAASQDEKTLAIVMHVFGLIGLPILGPLIVWIMKKDQSSPQQRKQLSKIFKDLKKLTRG